MKATLQSTKIKRGHRAALGYLMAGVSSMHAARSQLRELQGSLHWVVKALEDETITWQPASRPMLVRVRDALIEQIAILRQLLRLDREDVIVAAVEYGQLVAQRAMGARPIVRRSPRATRRARRAARRPTRAAPAGDAPPGPPSGARSPSGAP